jgi:hypothetical protein
LLSEKAIKPFIMPPRLIASLEALYLLFAIELRSKREREQIMIEVSEAREKKRRE